MRQKSQPYKAMALTSAILSQYVGSLYMGISLRGCRTERLTPSRNF
ncbi:hypothetical protein [Peribacillus loiseleuriae]|nr:hypothetical protein [Peribacillus loiseleuriae]